MQKLRLITYILALCCVAVFLFSGAGLSAAWLYNVATPQVIDLDINVTMFAWQGSEDLPDDVYGENHRALIQKILDGTATDSNGNAIAIGLNNPDSYISNEIIDRTEGSWFATSDTLGSMDVYEASSIANYFETETTGLTFLLYFPDGQDGPIYLYTTNVELGQSSYFSNPNFNIPQGQKVYPVYRTILQKNDQGRWIATESKEGYALSALYDNRIFGSGVAKCPSIDPTSWTEAQLGLSISDAIVTYIGQTTTAYVDNNDALYYALTTSSRTTVTVSSTMDTAQITITDANSKKVAITGGAQESKSVTFTTKAGTTYYIKVAGGQAVPFSVE